MDGIRNVRGLHLAHNPTTFYNSRVICHWIICNVSVTFIRFNSALKCTFPRGRIPRIDQPEKRHKNFQGGNSFRPDLLYISDAGFTVVYRPWYSFTPGNFFKNYRPRKPKLLTNLSLMNPLALYLCKQDWLSDWNLDAVKGCELSPAHHKTVWLTLDKQCGLTVWSL